MAKLRTITSLEEWAHLRKGLQDDAIGFVPTLGNLHAGHLQLCAESMRNNKYTVVSIYLNQTQFDQPDDFTKYPRTLESDQELLAELGVDFLLAPDQASMYPDNFQVQVSETEISTILEGAVRPGHFTGMLTIVLKLLNIVRPTRAYFGEKDYQQLLLVRKMVAALFMPTTIIGCPIVRAEDGLPLSSRNSRLSLEQRELAASFPRLLQSNLNHQEIEAQLKSLGFKVDYIAEFWQRRLGAVRLGTTRLLDNFPI